MTIPNSDKPKKSVIRWINGEIVYLNEQREILENYLIEKSYELITYEQVTREKVESELN